MKTIVTVLSAFIVLGAASAASAAPSIADASDIRVGQPYSVGQ
jgi:hypothetical protein